MQIQCDFCFTLLQLKKLGEEKKLGEVDVYNLDVVVVVGYRVNSSKANQFRIWATNVIRNYLVEGYAINQRRLTEENTRYLNLQKQLKTLRNVLENEDLDLSQSKELVMLITDYAKSLELLYWRLPTCPKVVKV